MTINIVNIVLIIHFLLLIVISLRVLSRHDLTSPARLVWLVVLFLLPYAGVVVYWLFGEIHLGRDFERKNRAIINRLHAQAPEVLGSEAALRVGVKPEYHAAFSYGANITGYHTTLGNRAELMADADETRARMIADFDAALIAATIAKARLRAQASSRERSRPAWRRGRSHAASER